MRKQDLIQFLRKKVKLTLDFGLKAPIFYTGEILELNEDSLTFKDKFGKLVVVNYLNILKVEEC